MSTTYTLAKVGPVELFATERSSKVEIGVNREDRPNGEGYLDTDAIFSDVGLIEVIVELVKVASYISEDPELIKKRVGDAIDADSYLGSMDWI